MAACVALAAADASLLVMAAGTTAILAKRAAPFRKERRVTFLLFNVSNLTSSKKEKQTHKYIESGMAFYRHNSSQSQLHIGYSIILVQFGWSRKVGLALINMVTLDNLSLRASISQVSRGNQRGESARQRARNPNVHEISQLCHDRRQEPYPQRVGRRHA